MDRRVWIVILSASLTLACSKKEPAAPAPSAPVAATTPAAPAPAPAAAPASAEDPDVAAKRKAMEFALREDGYKNDPQGQWAVDAKASSSYDETGKPTSGYHPMRATGAPDAQHYGDVSEAWTSKNSDGGIEWLELSYAKPVNATELRIRQNNAPGAIIKVELFEVGGAAHTVFQGPDATAYEPHMIAWLNIKFDKTPYKTQRVKITLATNAVPGWNEIDAVQLVGE